MSGQRNAVFSFIDLSGCEHAQADQPEVIRRILEHLGLWEESHAPPDLETVKREITFDPSYGSINSPSEEDRGTAS